MGKIEWAPLNVPMRRRVETLSTALWMWLILFGELGMLISYFLLLIYGNLFIKTLCVIYGYFIYTDRKVTTNGGRGQGVKWWRDLFWWKLYQSYFPAKLHKTVDLDPNRNYLFAAFPHGVLGLGAFINFATNATGFHDKFPKIRSRPVTLNFHFVIPFFREILLSWGLVSANPNSILSLLKATNKPDQPVNDDGFTSNAVVIVVGGAAESLHCRPNNYTLVLRKRKGFCKLAIKAGTPIVPVMTFGEVDLFDQPPNPPGSKLRRFQEFVKNTTGIAPAAFVGRGFFQYSYGLIPRRKPLNTVVGVPVEVTQIDNPTNEQVDEVHERFCRELDNLFETNKARFIADHKNVKLVLE